MAKTLKEIQAPIRKELEHFEVHFRNALRTKVLLLDKIMQYLIKRKGKQLRPMLVLLSASVCGGIQPATYRGAALVELLHTATLIHDDVVDDAEERRGFFSLNALWKNKIAVLVGDFLLSRGLLMSLEAEDFLLLKIVSNAVKLMSEGELLQIEKARTLNIDVAVYLEIIRMKTASLIASCTECGAASVSQDPKLLETFRLFGEKTGIAFQIKDDLLDYGEQDIGKPLGIDLKEKKMTLPLIHSLNQASWYDRRKVISLVKNHNGSKKELQWIKDFIVQNQGIEYSQKVMHQYKDEAIALLEPFPDSPSKQALIDLVHYAIERSY